MWRYCFVDRMTQKTNLRLGDSVDPAVTAAALKRRLLLWGFGLAALGLAGCASSSKALAQPSFTIPVTKITEALARKFPRTYGVSGLMDLQLLRPQIGLLPEQNKLNAVIDVQASGALLQSRSYGGALDVDFGLRYEPSDRSLRATQIRFNGLRMQGLNAQASQMLQRYGAQIAEQSLQEVVLHQFSPADLALADGLGLQPGKFSVTPNGLVVELERKAIP